MPWCHAAYGMEDAERWLQTQHVAFERGMAFEFAVFTQGRYCGGCGLNQIDLANRRANLGYWIRSGMTRQGVATAAACLIRDWAFEQTDLIRLEILVAQANIASRRVAEKSGAHYEGLLCRRLVLHGRSHDAALYAFTRPIGQ